MGQPPTLGGWLLGLGPRLGGWAHSLWLQNGQTKTILRIHVSKTYYFGTKHLAQSLCVANQSPGGRTKIAQATPLVLLVKNHTSNV